MNEYTSHDFEDGMRSKSVFELIKAINNGTYNPYDYQDDYEDEDEDYRRQSTFQPKPHEANGNRYSNNTKEEARRLYLIGYSNPYIAKKLHVSRQSISNWCKGLSRGTQFAKLTAPGRNQLMCNAIRDAITAVNPFLASYDTVNHLEWLFRTYPHYYIGEIKAELNAMQYQLPDDLLNAAMEVLDDEEDEEWENS